MGWYGGFAPYVSVAERKRQAARKISELKKKGQVVQPVILADRIITKTFWGKAWCTHLESYSDYENRLPRGRTYVRNGSVIDLQIQHGEIKALVSGSAIYKIKISIAALAANKWQKIAKECTGKIDSLIELLQGKFSQGVMEIITHNKNGLFPQPKEIKFNCSCPDWAEMCKHVAAVLYGIGARFDERPEELFLLRKVDHSELIAQAGKTSLVKTIEDPSQVLADSDLSALFGIDMEKPSRAHSAQKKSKFIGSENRKLATPKKLNKMNKKLQTTKQKSTTVKKKRLKSKK